MSVEEEELMPAKLNQAELKAELVEERRLLTAYLEALPEGAWDKESLCEGWRIKDVVAHVVGNAADISSGNTADAGSPEYNARQVAERTDRTPAQLLEEWATVGPAFEDGITALDDAFFNADYPPFGTVGEALRRFSEDTWIHRQDIRVPLGDGVDPQGPGVFAVLAVALFEAETRMPQHAPSVRSVTIDADGSKETVKVADEGVDVTVSGDAATIALVATGRYDLDKVTVSPEIPDGFATAFNIYAS
jgi:uncharacterized protein (TIGR03083 family)